MPEAPNDVTIRRAGAADAETLAFLGARTFSDAFEHLYDPQDYADYVAQAYALERIRDDLADPAKALWLVEVDGQPVGYALAGPCGLPHDDVTAACGELKRIYFVREVQGGGLGKALFKQVMDWLQAEGPRDVWIGVWSENLGALRFYERQGFAKAGEYDFHVGRQVDREFILRKPAESFAAESSQLASLEHNLA